MVSMNGKIGYTITVIAVILLIVVTIGITFAVEVNGDKITSGQDTTDGTNEVDFGPEQPIIPGMTVNVDILTGRKTVLSYLMKPVLRAQQRALSER